MEPDLRITAGDVRRGARRVVLYSVGAVALFFAAAAAYSAVFVGTYRLFFALTGKEQAGALAALLCVIFVALAIGVAVQKTREEISARVARQQYLHEVAMDNSVHVVYRKDRP